MIGVPQIMETIREEIKNKRKTRLIERTYFTYYAEPSDMKLVKRKKKK